MESQQETKESVEQKESEAVKLLTDDPEVGKDSENDGESKKKRKTRISLRRKKKRSRNREKAKIKLAKTYARIAANRSDALHTRPN